MIRFIIDRFLVLPLGAAIAIAWANLAGESYFRFAHALAFPVNEIGMAFFLALLTQEVVEATMPGGALHTWRRWSLPLAAAGGGVLGAVATYLAWVNWQHELVLAAAWPIASAIDIAAGYYVLKIVRPRHGAIPFLLLLAIATNALGLLIMGLGTFRLGPGAGGAALVLGAVGLAALLRRRGIATFWPYLGICGTLSWIGCYAAGAHPALALVPIVPFLPHRARAHNPFADPAGDDDVQHVEREWNHGVQVVLFMFGLVNAGVLVTAYDTGTWAVLAASMVGRPLGILAAVGLALAAGLHLPRRLAWRDLVVVALATSSGFTFALFFATSLLPMGAVLTQVKVGALATMAGGAVAIAAARLLRVGRYAH